jgi:hypothetical protein
MVGMLMFTKSESKKRRNVNVREMNYTRTDQNVGHEAAAETLVIVTTTEILVLRDHFETAEITETMIGSVETHLLQRHQ